MYEKSASDGQTRQKSAKTDRAGAPVYEGVNEYFELIFNAVWPSAGSFRTKPNLAAYRKRVNPVVAVCWYLVMIGQ